MRKLPGSKPAATEKSTMTDRREPPKRGELYLVDLEPIIGHEQAGRRPFLVLSILAMNRAATALTIGLPITTTPTGSALHTRIEPAESGLDRVSYAMPEMIRSVSTERFGARLGRVPIEKVESAANLAGFLIGLGQTKY
jgi:mRNA interferase MazF